jgi:TolB-like protein
MSIGQRPKAAIQAVAARRAFKGRPVADRHPSGRQIAGDQVSGINDPPSPAEVRDQLQRILDSPSFEASDRRRRFLGYVVDELLAGRADRLKGYSIATAVFERDDSFDPQTDPVVRLEARRLRRGLEHYYLTAGRDDPIRIEIPKGGYAPTCERRASALADLSPAPAAPDPSEALPPPASRIRVRRHRLAIIGLAIFLSALAGLAVMTAWLWLTHVPAGPNVASQAQDLQWAGPAVAIVPFDDLSGTEPGRLFAGGLTQDLIASLMRFQNLRVYEVPSGGQWRPDPADLGQQPEVRYEIKGSVRRTPERIRLAVQLLEVGSGRYLWSETYDRPLTTEDVFAVQEELAAELAGRLAEPYGVVHKVSADLFRRRRPETLAAYDCVLQAFAYRPTFSQELYRSTRKCLDETVRRDPAYPDGWAMLAFAHLDEYRWYGFGPLHGQRVALDQALAAAERAKELDPDNVTSLSAYAAVQYYRGEFAEAERAQRRAVTLNPNNPEILAQLGWRLAFVRDWDAGIGLVRQAARQSMLRFGWYYMILAFDSYRRSDYRKALADMNQAGELGFFGGEALVAMCQAELGNPKAARQALDRAIALDPTLATDPRGAYRLHHVPESLIDKFIDGLRKAGLEVPGA